MPRIPSSPRKPSVSAPTVENELPAEAAVAVEEPAADAPEATAPTESAEPPVEPAAEASPPLSEITLVDVLGKDPVSPEQVEFLLDVPAETVRRAIEAGEFPRSHFYVTGGRPYGDDVAAWIERRGIPTTPHPEAIRAIRERRGELIEAARPKPAPKPIRAVDDPIEFEDVFTSEDGEYSAHEVEQNLCVSRHDVYEAAMAGEISGERQPRFRRAELLAWLQRTGRGVVVRAAAEYRVKEQRAAAIRQREQEEKNRAEAAAAAEEAERRRAVLRESEIRERERQQAEAEHLWNGRRHYVAILRRADEPLPDDSATLAEIARDFGISHAEVVEARAVITQVHQARERAAEHERVAAESRAHNRLIEDMKARHAFELKEAVAKKRSLDARSYQTSTAKDRLESLRARHPHLFEAGGDPPRLLGETEDEARGVRETSVAGPSMPTGAA